MNITEITSTKKQIAERLRLAPYCRVLSDSTDQLHSFAAQIRYYSDYAKKYPEYQLVDIYADEGITGTEMKKRDELNRLIADFRKGKVDRIIVKSVSRLARNTEELLVLLRMCKEIGVSVYFEEQGIDTEKLNMEMIVTFPGMAAQQESVNISGNLRWNYQKRMQSGDFNCTCPAYGFDLKDGELVINETEAAVIRRGTCCAHRNGKMQKKVLSADRKAALSRMRQSLPTLGDKWQGALVCSCSSSGATDCQHRHVREDIVYEIFTDMVIKLKTYRGELLGTLIHQMETMQDRTSRNQ